MCFDVGIAIKNRKCLLESVSVDSFIARPHTDTERGGGGGGMRGGREGTIKMKNGSTGS